MLEALNIYYIGLQVSPLVMFTFRFRPNPYFQSSFSFDFYLQKPQTRELQKDYGNQLRIYVSEGGENN